MLKKLSLTEKESEDSEESTSFPGFKREFYKRSSGREIQTFRQVELMTDIIRKIQYIEGALTHIEFQVAATRTAFKTHQKDNNFILHYKRLWMKIVLSREYKLRS